MRRNNHIKMGLRGAVAPALFAGSIGCACAQSSVTLYGIIDDALSYSSKTLNPSTGRDGGHQIAMIDGQVFWVEIWCDGCRRFRGSNEGIFQTREWA